MLQPAKFATSGNQGVRGLNFSARFNAKKITLSVLLVITLVCTAFGVPTKFQKGITIHQAGVAPGYVITNLLDGKTYAIDVNGQFVKTWVSPVPGSTLDYSRPLNNKNILARISPAAGAPQEIIEMNQAGALVWSYTETADRLYHHDQARLQNGNTLIVCSRTITVPSISAKPLVDDCLLEVNPAGQTVFTWQTADHFDEFNFSDTAKAMISANAGDWAHMNSAEEIPPNANSSDPRFKPGNIIVSYRHINIVIIVDPTTGSIVWKMDNVTEGQHDPTMLRTDQQGAGHILVFDNGFSNVGNNPGPTPGRFYTRILEINVLDQSIAYEYNESMSDLPIWWLFSPFVGSVQRLPNGDTLIDEGSMGRIFEVNPLNKIVWEWVNSVVGTSPAGKSSHVYRAEKVALSWLQP